MRNNKSSTSIHRKVTLKLNQGKYANKSRRIAELYSTNSQAFVNIMMLEELGLVVNDSN